MAESDEVVLRGGRHAGEPLEPAVQEERPGRGDADLQPMAANETSLEKRLGILHRVSEILGRLERKMRRELEERSGK